jgi:hypothetical protein
MLLERIVLSAFLFKGDFGPTEFGVSLLGL